MIAYLIKSAACLILLLLVYHAFLEREKMHRFNRYFLLFSLIFSLSIPLLTIEIGAPAQLTDQINEIKNRLSAGPPAKTQYVPMPDTESQRTQTTSDSSTNYTSLLIGLYSIIASILLVRLLRNLYLLIQKIRVNPRVSLDTCTLVLIDDCDIPHSFFNYIFVDKQLYESGQVRAEILNHERTHSRQRHSLDILFIEVLKVLYWFNPVLWFYKRAMQVNHEFLADESVIAGTTDVQGYQKMLLKMQSGSKYLQLASSIQFSITKKRIIMMTKKSTRLRTVCKQLAIIPLIAGLAFIFCTKTATAQDISNMSLPELMEVVASKMESLDSLPEQEKQELNRIITEIQKELKFQVPPPPAPAPISEGKEETLQRVVASLQEHSRFYADIKPVLENMDKLEASYEKLMLLYDNVVEIENEIKENPPPPPPKPLEPAKRIERHAKKSVPAPPPPISETTTEPKEALNKVYKAYQARVNHYNSIEAEEANKEKLETAHKRLKVLYDKIDELQDEAYPENPPPLPPMPLEPKKIIERNSKATGSKISADVSDNNHLNILVNSEGLILINEELIPLGEVTATVKKFITNNGADPQLSDSPQKTVVSIEITQETPFGAYTDVFTEVKKAYLEARNIAAQAAFGVNYNRLDEDSDAKKKIEKMYPKQISVAIPEQKKDATKTQPPPPKPIGKVKTHPIPEAA